MRSIFLPPLWIELNKGMISEKNKVKVKEVLKTFHKEGWKKNFLQEYKKES